MRSSVLVEANWLSYCKAIFGDYYTDDMPRVDYYINKYSGISDAAKIIFLNAAEDPWQYAGMSQNVPKDVSYKSYLIDCQNCGHCIDLSTPSPNDPPILT